MSAPRCSIVIPSHNRRALLEQVLEGLARQTVDLQTIEGIVVLDGPTDDSPAMLEAWVRRGRLPHLRWVAQSRSGQARARTEGARLAGAPVLVFFDDDVVPEPDCLAAHLRWHRDGQPLVVLGDYPVVRPPRASYYHLVVWAWWEDLFARRAQPGWVPSYLDFCAGNVSLRREDFWRVGGFDPAFRGYGGEDYDLGYRLLQAGVRFVAEPTARAAHHHKTRPRQVLRQMREEGRNNVLLGRKHPDLRRGLRLMRQSPEARQVFAHATFRDLLAALLKHLLPFYERVGFRGTWRRLFGRLRHYAYWQGVRDALGRWDALEAYCREAPPPPTTTLEISAGLPAILPLWGNGPSEVIVTVHGRTLGVVYLAEPLEGPVRTQLADQIIYQLEPRLWMLAAEEWSSSLEARRGADA